MRSGARSGTSSMMQLRHVIASGFLLCLALQPAMAATAGGKPALAKPATASAEQRTDLHELLEREAVAVGGRVLDPLPLRQLYAATGDDLLWLGHQERVEAL